MDLDEIMYECDNIEDDLDSILLSSEVGATFEPTGGFG
jgi:hypothetical protein